MPTSVQTWCAGVGGRAEVTLFQGASFQPLASAEFPGTDSQGSPMGSMMSTTTELPLWARLNGASRTGVDQHCSTVHRGRPSADIEVFTTWLTATLLGC